MRDVNLGMRVEILHNVGQEGNGIVTTMGCEGLLWRSWGTFGAYIVCQGIAKRLRKRVTG